MNKRALIVIDAQESFRHTPYWSEADLPSYLAHQQRLIDHAASEGIAIVQVLHVGQGPFAPASGHVRTLAGLDLTPDLVIHKQYHSALASTPLAAWLREHGIRQLTVSGIRTEQCCETTTRHASDSGFAVDFVSEATLTFAMTHVRSGRTYTPAEIRERTELVLEQRFARILSVAEATGG